MTLDNKIDISSSSRSPIINGNEVLFFYKRNAKAVYLAGDYNIWVLEDKMERQQGNGIWYVKKSFPPSARFDYKYIVDGEWITDPLNGNTTPSGSGYNSTLIMPGYCSDYERIIDSDVPQGSLIRDILFDSKYMKTKMKYHVYLPPLYNGGTINHILYALDGSDYLNYAKINKVLDYLISNNKMPKAAVVLIDTDERSRDLTLYEPYLNYITRELMPAAESEYINPDNGLNVPYVRRSVTGVSWGALTALYLAVTAPFPFDSVLTQSGSYWPNDWRLFDIVAKAQTPRISFFMQTGTIQDTVEMNDAMAELLKKKGLYVDYVKYAETHSWYNWRGHLDEGLKKMYGNLNI